MQFCNNLQGTFLNTETFTKIDFGISLRLAVSKLGIRFLHGRNIFLAACNISLLCEISIHFLHEQTLGGGGVVTINFSFNMKAKHKHVCNIAAADTYLFTLMAKKYAEGEKL